MARSSVTFVLGQGQLGQHAAGTDFISGMVLYGTAPGSFVASVPQAIYSVADAETKGIDLDYSDETAVKAIVTISGSPAAGDTLAFVVTEPNPNGASTAVTLGTGTAPATPTATTYADACSAAINALTYVHGYTAANTAGVITLTGRAGLGISLNPAVTATPLAITATGSATTAITQQFGTGTGGATAGVYSKKAVWHYIVSEYFRANPTGKLWVCFFASVSATFAEISTLQAGSGGECSQIGVFNPTVTSASAFSTNMVTIQARANDLFNAYTPAVIHYAPNIKAVSDLSTLVNQQIAGTVNKNVLPIILQDGDAVGAQLFVNSGISMTNIGCSIGTTSASAVNQDIGEIGAFNLSDGVEMNKPAFANGQLVSAIASSLLDQLDAYRYIFATGLPRVSGTYFVNDWTAIAQTSDYNRQSRMRVINKAVTLAYIALVPLLKSQIKLNEDGTISYEAIQAFTGAVIPVKTQMVGNDEISNMGITINPAQNIITTGKIVIGVKVQPTVTADFIEVDLSFTAKL